jgi:hypothetical protein
MIRGMTWIQRSCLWVTRRILPGLDKLLRTAGGKLEYAEAEIAQLRERDSERRRKILEEKQELRESAAMLGPQWTPHFQRPTQATAEALREAHAPDGVVMLAERLWELELALEDRGWVREITLSNFEFSLMGIQRIIGLCRLYALKNPLIRRGIQVSAFYVFGRGVSISSDDPDENSALDAFFKNPRNAQEIGHRALVKKEEQIWSDGNIYWVFFADEQTGELIIRCLDPIEIVDIVTNPDDSSEEWYIHRRWMAQNFDPITGQKQPTPMQAWYPALGFDPADKPPTIGAENVQVKWDTPCMHWKEGGNQKWLYGVPLAYPAIDPGRQVKRLIDNWCSIQEAMTRFAWQVETQGGLPAIANLKQTLATTLAIGDGSMYEQNPPPNTASSWISGPGNKLSMSKTSGMIDSPEVGRRVAHLCYMVFGLPETFFADASVGTVATATSLDRPTELKFLEAQERWREGLQRMGDYVIMMSETSTKGKIYEARKTKPKVEKTAAGSVVKVQFPSILEHDIKDQIAAIVEAATLNGFECTGVDERVTIGLLLQELQVENWQEVLELMYPEDEYEDLMDRTEILAQQREQALAPPPPPVAAVPPNAGPTGVPTPTPAKPPAGQPSPAAPPIVKSGKPKRASAGESVKIARAVASLKRAAKILEARAISK